MITRTLGSDGPTVSAIGLGCMGMSDLYGPTDQAESVATIHAALDGGITLLDTGDYYAMGDNEMLIRDALRDRDRDRAVISVKFGVLRDPAGGWAGVDGRPVAVKNFLAYTLRRLGTDHVDIYRLAPKCRSRRPSARSARWSRPATSATSASPRSAPKTIRRAQQTHPISDLQIEYSLISRGIEAEILPTCRGARDRRDRLRRALRGLLSGHWSKDRATGPADFRSHAPRFSGENLERNLELVEALRGIAEAKDATVAQVAIAWVLSRGADVVPLVGARTREQPRGSLGAVELDLSAEELAAIEAAVPAGAAAGERYDDQQMAVLDSEPTATGAAATLPSRSPPSASSRRPRTCCAIWAAKATVVDVARELGVSHGASTATSPARRRCATPSPSAGCTASPNRWR